MAAPSLRHFLQKIVYPAPSYSEPLQDAHLIIHAATIGDGYTGSPPAVLIELGTAIINSAATGIACTLTKGANVTDDVIVVALSNSTTASISSANLSDSQLNSYTLDVSAAVGSTGAARFGVWRSHIATKLNVGDQVVFNNGAATAKAIYVFTLSTPSVSPSVDVTLSGAGGTGTSMATGTSSATVQVAELVLAAWGWNSNSTFSPPAGFTSPPHVQLTCQAGGGSVVRSLAVAWKNVIATGTQAATATLSASQPWNSVLETFKVFATGGVTYIETLPAADLILHAATISDAYGGAFYNEAFVDSLIGICANSMTETYAVEATYYEPFADSHIIIHAQGAADSYTHVATNVPTLQVEIAFATNPLDDSPIYSDVTQYVQSFNTRRGRSHELNRIDAGTATLKLYNQDRTFDPTYTGSTFYPNVLPLRKCRISLILGTSIYRLFTGYVERWPMSWDNGGLVSEIEVGLVDGFDFLSATYLQTVHATMTTDVGPSLYPNAGAGADITYTAKGAGIDGNALSVMYYERPLGPSADMSVAFGEPSDGIKYIQTDGAIIGPPGFVTPIHPLTLVVVLAKGGPGGEVSTTVGQIVTAVNAHATASKYLTASVASGSDEASAVPGAMPTRSYLAGFSVPLTGGTYESEFSGTRVNHVLDDIGWPATNRRVDIGRKLLVAAGFDLKDQQTALQHLQDVSDAERGYVFIGGDGALVFHDNWHRAQNAAPVITFGDAIDGVELEYTAMAEASLDRDEIRNDITVTLPDGTEIDEQNSTSIATYGLRSYRTQPALSVDNDGTARAEYLSYRYADPHLRVGSISSRPVSFREWVSLLPREIGDRVIVKRRPPGGGLPISLPCFIEQISWSGQEGAIYDVQFQLSPADRDQFLVMDDSVYGLMNIAKVGE